MGAVGDIDFEALSREIDSPNTEGFEFFVQTMGTTIYRQYNETSGLYTYKIYGSLDVAPEICAQVYMDIDYRKSWDTYVKDLEILNVDGEELIYWQVNFPWPMSNRDYVYTRSFKELDVNGEKVWIVCATGKSNTDKVAERSGVVRVSDYTSYSVMKSDGKGGSKAYQLYFDNPGGSIPTWLINWGAKTGVPQFLTTMQKACRGYEEYSTKSVSQ